MESDYASELMQRRVMRRDFGLWCEHALAPSGLAPARHHRLLIRELQAVADGESDRLLICMPPGSAKSTYASILFPAWLMARKPGVKIIGVSHGSKLAEDFSKMVQGKVRAHSAALGYTLLNEAVDRWFASNGGFYRAAGTGGSITGRRADCIIWDDPLTAEQSASQTYRNEAWNFYQREMVPRLLPHAAIVLITTRWDPDDPAGRLLADMAKGGTVWRVLSLPAIAETHDELGRVPGEVLWPEWEDLDAINRKRREVGERAFAALFQQRPTVQEGAIIKREWWRHHDAALEPPNLVVMSLDTAHTEKEANDASACTVWHLLPDGPFRSKLLLRYAWRERLEFPKLVEHVRDTAGHVRFCPPGVPLRLLIEAKASGLPLIQELRRRWPELTVSAVTPRGDKVARAHAVTSLLEAGKVLAVARDGELRPWAQMVVDECAAFPAGANDDLVDTVTQALKWFREAGLEWFSEDQDEPARVVERVPLY